MDRLVPVIVDETLDPAIVRIQGEEPPDCGWYEQVALDVAQAPDEEVETGLRRLEGDLLVVVPIEHDQAGQARASTSSLLEIRYRTGGLPTPENHGVLLDATDETRVGALDAPRPTLEELAIPGTLDVEHEISLRMPAPGAARAG